ncbi:MAG: copper homeostasis protein CutC [Saprospiraceae bacterium]
MPILEVCAANIASVAAAVAAKADRIELCAALGSGGLTPGPGLIEAALGMCDIPVRVLIRPREGDFCYAAAELRQMLSDIRHCKRVGVAGVVVGALLPDGRIDAHTLAALIEEARPLSVTFHRAIDLCADPAEALEYLIEAGADTVLSSGGAPDVWAGRQALQALVRQAAGRIDVMPGGGLRLDHAAELHALIKAPAYHLSASAPAPVACARSLPGLSPEWLRSDQTMIACFRKTLG